MKRPPQSLLLSRRKLDDVLAERINPLSKTVFPNLKIDCGNRPYHAGTLTVVDMAGVKVLVTARHVLDIDQANECDFEENQLRALGSQGPVQLHPFEMNTITPEGVCVSPLDIAVLRPEWLDTENLGVVAISDSSIYREALHGKLYMAACGFPATKNNSWAKRVTQRPYSYFGLVAGEDAVRRAGFDPRYHFAIKIDLKRVFRGSEKRVRAPDPSGISGGPVFIAHDFDRPGSWEGGFAGIVVARDELKKHLICVRATVLDDVASTLSDVGLPG